MISENKVDRIVLGTAGLAGLWGAVEENESIKTILTALELGIRHFDTAPAYADAQTILSRALKEWKGEKPFVSTKAGKLKSTDPGIAICDYSPASLLKSVEESRRLLGMDVLDLVFLHDPVAMKPEEMVPAMETLLGLQAEGKIARIGIGGNYGPDFSQHALSGFFSHFMGFNRYNLVRQLALKQEFAELDSTGLEIWQASPLYMGLLGRKQEEYLILRPEWIPEEDLIRAETLKKNCDARGLDLTGLALNFIFNSKCIDKLVIGACNVSELMNIREHLENKELKEESLLILQELNTKGFLY